MKISNRHFSGGNGFKASTEKDTVNILFRLSVCVFVCELAVKVNAKQSYAQRTPQYLFLYTHKKKTIVHCFKVSNLNEQKNLNGNISVTAVTIFPIEIVWLRFSVLSFCVINSFVYINIYK